MAMPASESSSGKASDGLSGLDSFDANNEFNRNFNQSLLGLKALNSQTGQELNFSEYLSLRMEKKDEDVVILEDPSSITKNCNEIKTNKFTINDNIRNSFKDIMSNVKNGKLTKPQEEVNSLGNLLAQTKSFSFDNLDKPSVAKNGTTQNVSEKSVGSNLFENLKDIQNTTVTQGTRPKEESKDIINGDFKINPEVIELDDSLEEELLKSSDESTSPKQDDKTLSNDIDKKEEEKLLQIDDAPDSIEDKPVSNDLKEENKLLELNNEDSNHSVTSVKSDHSIKSNHSVKSDHSIKSNHSVKSNQSIKSIHSVKSEHSVKSVQSIHLEDSNHSTKSATPSLQSESRSQSPSPSCDGKPLNILNHNDCSNHSVNSCSSQQSVKSNKSVKTGSNINSVESEIDSQVINDNLDNENSNISTKSNFEKESIGSTSKLDQNSEKSNDSIKSGGSSTNSCNKTVSKENTDVDLSESTPADEVSQSNSVKSNDGEVSQSESLKLEDQDTANGNNGLEVSQKIEQHEVMDLDSDGENDDKACTETSSESRDTTDNEQCSVKTPSCDSEPKSIQSETSANCDEDNEKSDIKAPTSDRKRPADDEEDLVSSDHKRSRLDKVIGQLGNRTGIPLSRVKSMDELSDTDTSHLDSEMAESKSEDTSASEMEEEEEELSTPVQSPKKSRRVSQKDILKLVKSQVMCYLRSYRDETIRDLHRKIHDLQGTNDMWKNKAKELERKMLELTVLQQKHEKRKAKTAALRQISTKSIGVQVDVNKVEKPESVTSPTSSREMIVQNQTTPNKSGVKTPPRSLVSQTPPRPVVNIIPPKTVLPVITHQQIVGPLPNTSKVISVSNNMTNIRSTTIASTPSSIQQALNIPVMTYPQQIQNPAQQQQTGQIPGQQQNQILLSPTSIKGEYPSNKTVKSLLDSTRQQQQKTALNNTSVNAKIPIPPPQFIMVTSTPSSGTAVKTSIPASVMSTVAKAPMKVIDLTDEEENANKQPLQQVTKQANIPAVITTVQPTQGLVRGMAPQQVALPQQNIILNSPAGTRFINPQQQPLHLVFSGTPNIRPGNLLQVVTAPTAPGQAPGVRGPVVSQQAGVPPPQLRPGTLLPLTTLQKPGVPATSAVTGVQPQRAVRPPPPLQSAPNNQTIRPLLPLQAQVQKSLNHPAALPHVDPPVIKPGEKPLAPKPTLKISRVSQGIVLSWNMTYIAKNHAEIQSYQLFAYQETAAAPLPSLWKKVGDVKALPLPMACTLTQFQEGNRYHFAVRPLDVHGRPGPFSDPSSIHLMPMK